MGHNFGSSFFLKVLKFKTVGHQISFNIRNISKPLSTFKNVILCGAVKFLAIKKKVTFLHQESAAL